MIENFKFRRQFLLGPWKTQLPDWHQLEFDRDLHVAVHPDLNINQATRSNQIKLIVLGDLFDPHHPEHNNPVIISNIIDRIRTFDDFEKELETIGGRWLALIRIGNESRIYPDPSGSRPIYYKKTSNGIWVGSTPQLLADTLGYERDNALIEKFNRYRCKLLARKHYALSGDPALPAQPLSEVIQSGNGPFLAQERNQSGQYQNSGEADFIISGKYHPQHFETLYALPGIDDRI